MRELKIEFKTYNPGVRITAMTVPFCPRYKAQQWHVSLCISGCECYQGIIDTMEKDGTKKVRCNYP